MGEQCHILPIKSIRQNYQGYYADCVEYLKYGVSENIAKYIALNGRLVSS